MTKVKPGMFIGERYEVASLIGSGGTADVYKAMDRRLNRNVAIKILKDNFTGDKKVVEKFKQEAQACAGLTHPNIVSVYDVGNDGDLYYIVMEFIEGITLKRFIERKGKLEIKEAIGIAIQIAQGLDAAHANHIIHRDIKPQNIIISRDGKVKVTDFGIARATQGTSSNTINNQVAVGSVHYLSPEQARGGFSDERSDIYSLGVTIYEMLAGRVPYSGDSNVSVALLHIQGEATPLHEINPDVTPSVEKIVVKCMQKKSERRYFSAAELIKDLKASINNPSGDFVKLGKAVVNDSPTKEMSKEELIEIKSQVHSSIANEVEEDENEDDDDDNRDDDIDDDIDGVNTKTEKLIIIGSIALVIVLLAFVAVVFSHLDIFGGKNNETQNESASKLSESETKKLLGYGYTLDQMEVELKNRGILEFLPKGVYSDTVEKDKVIAMYYDGDTLVVEFSNGPKPADTVIMPNVIGKTLEEARKELLGLSSTLIIRTEANKDFTDNPINTIINQDIKEGTAIPLNQIIYLTYSIGPEEFELVDMVNGGAGTFSKEKVEEMYKDKLTIKYEYDATKDYSVNAKDMVVKTDPEAGRKMKKGDKLTVYLSSPQVNVPDVIGKSLSDAQNTIYNKGLRYNVIEVTEAEEGQTPGTVVKMSIHSGETVDRGTVIDITYVKVPDTPTPTPTATSTPKPTTQTPTPEEPDVTVDPTPEITPVELPNFIGWTIDDTKSFLDDAGIPYKIQYAPYNADYAPGDVIGMSHEEGAVVTPEETITIVVNSSPESGGEGGEGGDGGETGGEDEE